MTQWQCNDMHNRQCTIFLWTPCTLRKTAFKKRKNLLNKPFLLSTWFIFSVNRLYSTTEKLPKQNGFTMPWTEKNIAPFFLKKKQVMQNIDHKGWIMLDINHNKIWYAVLAPHYLPCNFYYAKSSGRSVTNGKIVFASAFPWWNCKV